MTSDAEIRAMIERLRQYEGRNWENTLCYNGLRDEAAAALSAMLEERDRFNNWNFPADIQDLTVKLEAAMADYAHLNNRFVIRIEDYEARITDLEQRLAKAREALEDGVAVVETVRAEGWDDRTINAIAYHFNDWDNHARSTLEAIK